MKRNDYIFRSISLFSSDLLDLKEVVGLNLHAGLRLRTVG